MEPKQIFFKGNYSQVLIIRTGPFIRTVMISGELYCSFSFLHYPSYYTYCSKKVYRTVNFYYCTAIPIVRTVLKNQACNIQKSWSYKRNLQVCTVLTDIGLATYFRLKRLISFRSYLNSQKCCTVVKNVASHFLRKKIGMI